MREALEPHAIKKSPPLNRLQLNWLAILTTGCKRLRQKPKRIIELMRLDQFYIQLPKAMRQFKKELNLQSIPWTTELANLWRRESQGTSC